VLALYWWNPFAWWAVRRLQDAEEECCDAAVLSFHPHDSEIYGEALLTVSEFVSCGSLPATAVSIGVERKNHLKRRMTMILSGSRWRKLTRAPLASVIVCALIVVGVSLRIAAAQVEPAADAKSTPVVEPPKPQTSPEKSRAMVATPRVAPDQSARPTANRHGETDRLPELLAASPLKAAPEDDDVRKLLKERYNVALLSLHSTFGAALTDSLPRNTAMLGIAARTLLEAELALAAPTDTLAVYERYLELTNYLDRRAEGLLKAKVIGQAEYEAARERRMDAEKKLRGELASRQHAGQEATKTGSPWTPPPSSGNPAAAPAKSLPVWMTAPPVGGSGDDELQKLLNERYNSALKSLQAHVARIEIDPNISIMRVVAAARTLLDAELAITPAADTFSVYPRYAEFLRYFDDLIGKRWAAKTIGADEFNAVHEARLDAEIKLRSHRVFRAPPAWVTAKALESAPGDDELRKLLKERYNSALKTLHALLAQIETDSNVRITSVLAAARTLRDDEWAIATTRAEAFGVRQRYVEFLSHLSGLISRPRANAIGADEINALVDAQKEAEPMRRNFSAQTSPARSTPSATERTESLPATQAAAIAPEPLPELLKAKLLEPAPGDHPLQKLFKDRYNAALEYLRQSYQRFQIPPETVSLRHGEQLAFHASAASNVYDAARRLVDAELALGAEPAAEIGVREQYVEFTRILEARIKQQAANGQIPHEFVDSAHEARLDAEIKLMQARSAVPSRSQNSESFETPIRRLALQSLETRVRIAEAEVVGARAAVGQSEAELKRALVSVKYRQLQLDRLQSLRKQNAVSEGGMEDATHARDETAASVDAARSTIDAAKAQVSIKEAQLQQARLELDNAKAIGAK
jgi:hypothetical protein